MHATTIYRLWVFPQCGDEARGHGVMPSPVEEKNKLKMYGKNNKITINWPGLKKQWAKSEELSVIGRGYLGPALGWPHPGRNPGFVPATVLLFN